MNAGWRSGVLALWATLHAMTAQGEIVIDRTRVIYAATAREATVNLQNEADSPRLVQMWIDDGDETASPETSDVPFTITPPIVRMDAGSARALRIQHHPAPQAAQGQESVYWLNVLAARPSLDVTDEASHLQFAFRTRIKLFLRPAGLPGKAEEAARSLQWRARGDTALALEVNNPTAYHVTLSSVMLGHDSGEIHHEDPPMIAPYSTATVAMPGAMPREMSDARLHFTTLDDHGITRDHEAQLQPPK